MALSGDYQPGTGASDFAVVWVHGFGSVEERERFRARALAAGWRTPALIFHGLADETVPASDSLEFVERVAFPKVELRLLKDGDHRLTAYKDEIAAESGRFFARLLSMANVPA